MGLPWNDESPLIEKIQGVERFLCNHRIAYQVPFVFEQDHMNKTPLKVLVFKYSARTGTSARRHNYWPVLVCVFGEQSWGLHTGLWHDSWAFPIITNDLKIVYNPRQQPGADVMDAMIGQIEYLVETHTSRIIKMHKYISTAQAHDFYLSFLRGSVVGKRTRMWFSLFMLLPPLDEKWSLLDHLSVLTNHLIDKGNVYKIGLLLGKLSDHVLLGVQPLLQARLVYRVIEAETPERKERNASVQWVPAYKGRRGKFFTGEERKRKNQVAIERNATEDGEAIYPPVDQEMDGRDETEFRLDLTDL